MAFSGQARTFRYVIRHPRIGRSCASDAPRSRSRLSSWAEKNRIPLKDAVAMVAGALPYGRRLYLDGQDHNFSARALAPLLCRVSACRSQLTRLVSSAGADVMPLPFTEPFDIWPLESCGRSSILLGMLVRLNRMVQYSQTHFDASFGALSDATRRGVLEQLGRADASITALAERFHMTLTGMRKHVGVLEQAGLVSTEKVGRVRTCKLGLRGLEEEAACDREVSPALGRALRRVGHCCRGIETQGESKWT